MATSMDAFVPKTGDHGFHLLRRLWGHLSAQQAGGDVPMEESKATPFLTFWKRITAV
jgi:hypothetical protein